VWNDTTLRDDNITEELVQPEHNIRRLQEVGEWRTYSSSFLMASCK
jgi:hypothetical protein